MSQTVFLFALCFSALLHCNSGAPETPNNNLGKYLASGGKIGIPAEFYNSALPRFKRKIAVIQRDSDEDTTTTKTKTKSLEIEDDDAVVDYEVAVNLPDYDQDISPTIVNGTRVDPSDPIPYQLSIRFQKKPPFGPWEHLCGAVILDENTAITAAHCFEKSTDVSRYRVIAGENLLDVYEKQEQILQLQRILIHPEYTDFRNGHDIAILHLDKIQFNEFARGVWLSHFSTQKLANLTGVVSGWGKTSDPIPVSNSLQKGDLSILSPKDCHSRLRRLRVSGPGILCALSPYTHTCAGDSGGPLVIQNYKLPAGNLRGNLLVGIVSFGVIKCDLKNSAGFFTEISHFYDWIQENRAKSPCQENYLPCVSGGGCFHADFKCDKKEDCADGTDEIDCTEKPQKTKSTTTTAPVVSPPSSSPSPIKPAESCNDAMEIFPAPRFHKQKIYPHGNGNNKSLEVLCDFETDGGGWTIIQKRTSGPKHEFDRTWTEYEKGFGSRDTNFWIGLENIHALTEKGDQELRIELECLCGERRFAKYSSFSVSNASDFYRLSISGYYGNAGDSMNYAPDFGGALNGSQFSTRDKDNDKYFANCAEYYGSGWWFNDCAAANLNGLYYERGEYIPLVGQGIIWSAWKGSYESLGKTEMKIRTRK